MKTIRYSFFGASPKNMDDCLDYLQNQPERKATVSVSLKKEERVTEQYAVEQFLAQYFWTFSDGVKAQYRKLYGGLLDIQGTKAQIKIIDRANQKVRLDLERLAQLGITLEKSPEVWTR
jgi:hypothetical protein